MAEEWRGVLAEGQKEKSKEMTQEQRIDEILNRFEERRLNELLVWGVMTALIGTACGVVCKILWGHFCTGLGIFGLIAGVALAKSMNRKHNLHYKQKVLPQILREECQSAEYRRVGHLGVETFRNTGLFGVGAKDYVRNEDCIYGEVEGIPFHFYEVTYGRLEKREDGTHERKPIFTGMAFRAEFPFEFVGNTIASAQPDPAEMKQSEITFEKIKLGDANFDRQMNIYTTSADTVPSMLSERACKAITDLRAEMMEKLNEQRMVVSFSGKEMLMLVPTAKDRFEADIFTKVRSGIIGQEMAVVHHMVDMTKSILMGAVHQDGE